MATVATKTAATATKVVVTVAMAVQFELVWRAFWPAAQLTVCQLCTTTR